MTQVAPRRSSRTQAAVRVVREGRVDSRRTDHLATEEPMETRVVAGAETRTVAVTMRTPGADFELAAGFLHGEGLLQDAAAISRISYCVDPEVDAEQRYNIVNVALRGTRLPDLPSLDRHFYTSSACGVCGKASIESLRVRASRSVDLGSPRVSAGVMRRLPDMLRAGQGLFDSTGGLHAAGLFTAEGELEVLREDVGRHNAVDKVVGWGLLNGRLPYAGRILMVSGRTSYEILQKAVAAGIPVVAAVSAPSSLAVDVAKEFGITLVGFLRDGRFNVYSGEERIQAS